MTLYFQKNIATPSFLKNLPGILFVVIRSVDWSLTHIRQLSGITVFTWAGDPGTGHKSSRPATSALADSVGVSLRLESFVKPASWVAVMRAFWLLEFEPLVSKRVYRKSQVSRRGGEPRSALCLPVLIEVKSSVHLVCSLESKVSKLPLHLSNLCSEEPWLSMQLGAGKTGLSQPLLFWWGVWGTHFRGW